MAAVAGSLDAFLDHVHGHRFQIVGPADFREEVDERGRQVGRVVAQLGRLVVPRERVVVVVETFAQRQHAYAQIFRRVDVPASERKAGN